jgi:signal transduction histidine kinase
LQPRRKAGIAFATAICLLTIGGVATAITIWNLIESLRWLAHSYQVELALGDLDSTLTRAARARALYIVNGDENYYRDFVETLNGVAPEIGRMGDLVRDNPSQVELIHRLEATTEKRADVLQDSVKLRHAGVIDPDKQAAFGRDSITLGLDQSDMVHDMQENEQSLIGQRRRVSDRLFMFFLVLLAATLITSALLFWWHYTLLRAELNRSEEMEEATRRLSSHVLEMQDEERRRFSRELHDSLGQLLTAAKLNMSALMKKYPQDPEAIETEQFLDQAVQETRTISYLLHPPLLDELGFGSAAEWYITGFAKRSGIQVDLKIAKEVTRLPHAVELVLFRVLQESLANVMRHAKTQRAEVSVTAPRQGIVLQVRDFGVGIAPDMLEQFNRTGARVGVGLAGMRERVREQGGTFEVKSTGRGTLVTVTMPRHSVLAQQNVERTANDPRAASTLGNPAQRGAPSAVKDGIAAVTFGAPANTISQTNASASSSASASAAADSNIAAAITPNPADAPAPTDAAKPNRPL